MQSHIPVSINGCNISKKSISTSVLRPKRDQTLWLINFISLNIPKGNSESYAEWLIMGMFNMVLCIIPKMRK